MISGDSHRQLKAVFEGRVQGVGFRYTVCRLASSFAVTGYVRNLMNGDVELVAEGSTDALRDFLDEIRGSHLGRHIVREHEAWSEASGRFSHFGILQ